MAYQEWCSAKGSAQEQARGMAGLQKLQQGRAGSSQPLLLGSGNVQSRKLTTSSAQCCLCKCVWTHL
jgi:hypothetical protein